MTHSKLWVHLAAVAVLLLPGASARAQGTIPDAPQLNEISPPSAQRGTSVDILLSGQRLDGATGLMCRYSAYPSLITSTDRGLKAEGVSAPSEGQVKARLVIPAEAPPGLHEVRAVTAHGVTGPAYFYVSQYPQTLEKEPNNNVGEATAVNLPVTLAGTIDGGEDQDYFSFNAKSGQTLAFDVEGFKRYSPPQNNGEGISYLDSFISLRDEKGRELAYSDDDSRLDAFLSYTFPADGKYCIAIRDNQYRGRGDFNYRMTVAPRPTITAIVPPGGQAGSRATVTVFGYNLDPSGATQVRRSVALSAKPGVQEFSITTPAGVSNSVPLVSDAFPEAPEVEPNDRIKDATEVILPVTCSGKFDSYQDVDGFRFQGQANQRLVFEIQASKLGSPVDTVITLLTRSGTLVARDDDGGGMPDSRMEVTLPNTDEYAVFVRNQVRSGVGPHQFYRLSIRPLKPTFNVVLRQEGVNRQGGQVKVPVDSLAVPQGGSVEFELQVNRVEGQTGDVNLSLSVPPTIKGLKLEQLKKTAIEGQIVNGQQQFRTSVVQGPLMVKNGETTVPMRLSATGEIKPGTYLNLYLNANGFAGTQPYWLSNPLWITVEPK